MRLDDALRCSVLHAVATLKQASIALPELDTFELADHLKRGPSVSSRYNYEAAITLLSQIRLPLADVPLDRLETSRTLIYLIVRESRPHWLRLARRGTQSLHAAVPTNVQQCLRSIGLFDPIPPRETQRWWDQIRAIAYEDVERVRIENGTRAEQLSLDREIRILRLLNRGDLQPKLASLISNNFGYDILSFRIVTDDLREWHIEVKGFSGKAPYFHLSPNEWEAAQKYANSYCLQLWSLDHEELVAELTCAELSDHIAQNRGYGEWDDLVISLNDVMRAAGD